MQQALLGSHADRVLIGAWNSDAVANLGLQVLTVLERDFVQLTHGKGAKLLQNRLGVQFILTGICLGLL